MKATTDKTAVERYREVAAELWRLSDYRERLEQQRYRAIRDMVVIGEMTLDEVKELTGLSHRRLRKLVFRA